jgi:hypothetical protein
VERRVSIANLRLAATLDAIPGLSGQAGVKLWLFPVPCHFPSIIFIDGMIPRYLIAYMI